MTGVLANAVERIKDDPAILGLGELEILRVLPSRCPDAAGLLLEGGLVLYVVDLQVGPVDDHQIIRVVERWNAIRRQHPSLQVNAVVVAQRVERAM